MLSLRSYSVTGPKQNRGLAKNPDVQPLTHWPDAGNAAKSAKSIHF